MIENVDIDLLEKTYKNAKTGITAIESVMDKASNQEFSQVLHQQLKDYQDIASKTQEQLEKHNAIIKDLTLIEKTMMKGNIKMNTMKDSSDSHIANMVIKGSTMGITQMTALLNDKTDTDGFSAKIAQEFIEKEQKNIEIMKSYL